MKAAKLSKLTVLTALTILLIGLSTGFEGGDGTSNSPYEIATCEQLQDADESLLLAGDDKLCGKTVIPIKFLGEGYR